VEFARRVGSSSRAEDCSSGDADQDHTFHSINDFTSCIDDSISNARKAAMDMGVPASTTRASRLHASR